MFTGLVGFEENHTGRRLVMGIEDYLALHHWNCSVVCVCVHSAPAKEICVGFSGSELVYYSKNSLAPELLINRTAAAAQSVTAELHNSQGGKRGGRW